uniref:Uncharacterized protein n=1 Tax=Nothobranchius furzeri TaxID=105023 RepID=A0A8C6NNI6_NOTFU
VAEDHSLCDRQASVQITERVELVLLPTADYIELLDGVQGLLFPLQLDDVRIRNDSLCKLQHRVLECCREKQHLTVFAYFIQHKDGNLLGVNHLVLCAPVQNRPWCSNHNVLLQNTFCPSDGICQLYIWAELPHLLYHLAGLQG